MTTRRDFIRVSAAMAGAAGLAGAGRAADAIGHHVIHHVVYDARFAESRAFGAEAARIGHRTVSIDGDVGTLWQTDLAAAWRRGPVAVAGMTAPDALFCIEQFAHDAGLRAVLRIDHRRTGVGGVAHIGEGVFDALAFDKAGDRFPFEAARAIGACPHGAAALGHACLAPRRAGEERLVTWAFAPRSLKRELA